MAEFGFAEEEGYSIITVDPNLVSATWDEVQAATDAATKEISNPGKVAGYIVDLSKLDYINSAAVASLVRIWKAIEAQDRRMLLVCPSERVTEILKVAGLLRLFHLSESRATAIHELGMSVEAKVEQRERRVLAFVAFPMAVLACIAFALLATDSEQNFGTRTEFTAIFLACLSLITACVSVMKDSGWRRALAMLAFAISLAVLAGLYFRRNPLPFSDDVTVFAVGTETADDSAGTGTSTGRTTPNVNASAPNEPNSPVQEIPNSKMSVVSDGETDGDNMDDLIPEESAETDDDANASGSDEPSGTIAAPADSATEEIPSPAQPPEESPGPDESN